MRRTLTVTRKVYLKGRQDVLYQDEMVFEDVDGFGSPMVAASIVQSNAALLENLFSIELNYNFQPKRKKCKRKKK